MIGALTYYLGMSLKNRLFQRLRRLRQPKYLLAAMVGLLYLWSVFFGPSHLAQHVGGSHRGQVSAVQIDPAVRASIGALVLFGLAVLGWVIPQAPAGLVFTEAEVALLFPAPIDRRTLIHFKLLKSQLSVLFTAILFAFIFRASPGTGPSWARAAGWWIIFTTINLHSIGAAFARSMLLDRGITTQARRVIVLGIVGVVTMSVGLWAWKTVPSAPDEIGGLQDVTYYFDQVVHSGPLLYVLAPFRFVVAPYAAPDGAAFVRAIGPALLILVAHYVWVVSSNVAFEEASIEASQRAAERLAAFRAGKRPLSQVKATGIRPPFRLSASGFPPVGILWKNLIGARMVNNWRLLLIAMAVSVAVASSGLQRSAADVIGFIILYLLVISLVMGALIVREDFRKDLLMADLMKTYPLPAWQVALGEILAPATILTVVQWCLIAASAVVMKRFGHWNLPIDQRLAWSISAAVIVPTLNLISLLIPNAAVLLFPGFFGPSREGGIEVMGQRMIFMVGQIVMCGLAMLLPAGAGAIVWFLTTDALGNLLAVPAAAVTASIVLAVEAAAGVVVLGALFERFDVSRDSVPG